MSKELIVVGKNGKNAASKTAEKTSAKKDVVVPEKKEEVKKLSIEERIRKLDDLNDLVDRRNRLKTSANKLNSFNLKKESHSTKIELTDDVGNRFLTSNSQAVESFINETMAQINTELMIIEEKINF